MTTNTTPPTDDELAAMRARVDAATPGPWEAYEDGMDWGVESAAKGLGLGFNSIVYVGWHSKPDPYHAARYRANHALIAAARRDMQTLLDEVARLRDLVERYGWIDRVLPPVDALK